MIREKAIGKSFLLLHYVSVSFSLESDCEDLHGTNFKLNTRKFGFRRLERNFLIAHDSRERERKRCTYGVIFISLILF